MDASDMCAGEALEGMIDTLHARGRLRVWSLIVTVFGDAIVPRGGRVALSVLQELMARLRIETGAVRTAMSRLAADCWLERERDGRNSYYRLADAGRHAFDFATRRIYAAGPPAWDGTWLVALAPGGAGNGVRAGREQAMAELGFAQAGAGSFVRPFADIPELTEDVPPGLLVVRGAALREAPDLAALWELDELAAAYRALGDNLAPLAAALARGAGLAPLDAMAARVLVDHSWRRIVLRDPGLPAALLPADWPGEAARARVKAVYAALAGPSEAWLDASGLPEQVDAKRFKARFGGI
ncbi:phenylacetic acid degradation protein [Nitratireductor sp. StC3]|nr:phenylacetic acid degradation protein [Nitratireductor sp. StC3]